MTLVSFSSSVSLTAIWVVAARLGLGPFGRLILEFIFHATVGLSVIHPLIRRLNEEVVLPHLRVSLQDELLDFAEEELSGQRGEGDEPPCHSWAGSEEKVERVRR